MHKARKAGILGIPIIYLVLALMISPLLFQTPHAWGEPSPAGWTEQWKVATGSSFKHASPTLADLEGDGYQEVLVGNLNGYLYCFDYAGNQRWAYGTGSAVQSTPLAVDVNQDGLKEIFFGSDNGWVYGLNNGGGLLAGWPQQCGVPRGGVGAVFGSPAAGDINGDGALEIVAGSYAQVVYAWTAGGAVLPGFPFDNYDSIWSSPACGDIDLDGKAEIVIGGDVTGASWWYAPGGLLWALNENGQAEPGFPKHIRQVIWSSPALGDLNGDQFPEIVVGTGFFYGDDVAQGDGYYVYAWDHLGNPVPGWPAPTGGNVFSSPALADVNGDGSLEVACGCNDGWLRLWASNGSLIWQRYKDGSQELGSPVIGDINSDGQPEILIGDSWTLTAYDVAGNLVLGQFQDGGILFSTPALGDIDKDGKVEVLLSSGARGPAEGGCEGTGSLFCYEAGTYKAAACPWPMFRRDAAHSAGYPHQEVADKWGAGDIKSQWYMAEGYTGPGFDEYILIMNPLTVPVEVQLRYLLPSGLSVVKIVTIPPGSRFTTLVNGVVSGSDVSVAAISNQPQIVIERAMYFNYDGKTGGTSVVGVDKLSTEWYLAEGYTGGTFDTYVLLANPDQKRNAEVDVTYMTDSGAVPGGHLSLKPKSRTTIHVDQFLPDANVSTQIVSNIPIAAERAMYFTYMGYIDGGHGAKGVTAPGTDWYMAEGFTRGSFDTYLLVQNPGQAAANCTATFMKPGGATQDFAFQVLGNCRFSLPVDGIPGMEDTEFSIHLHADTPVIAERAMYFNFNGKTGGHDVAGAPGPKTTWYLAEGCTANDFDTFILLQNPNASAVSVRVQYLKSTGERIEAGYTIDPNARFTIWADGIPELASAEFSTIITARQPIIVERAMYFICNGKDGGHCTLGYAPN